MTRHDPALPSPAPHPSPVLDHEAGVERLMGNRALYLRVLARFRSDYRSGAMAIRAALAAHDTTLAQRLAHTLKGAGGMIEAPALYGAAQALEDALRGGRRGDTLLLRLEAALADVLRELDGMDLVAAVTPAPVPAPVPAAARGDALAQLRTMLDIGDGAAVELVATARSELSLLLGERDYAVLSAAVANFDYERAVELLDRAGA